MNIDKWNTLSGFEKVAVFTIVSVVSVIFVVGMFAINCLFGLAMVWAINTLFGTAIPITVPTAIASGLLLCVLFIPFNMIKNKK